jgi:predicted Ser/Thr protein kinase
VQDIHFEEKNQIGKGAFSTVYKGNWIGTDVAVNHVKVKDEKENSWISLMKCKKKHLSICLYAIPT